MAEQSELENAQTGRTVAMSSGGPPGVTATLEAGMVIDERFRLEAPIGQGGMGVVWRATHLALQAPVAIKLLFPGQMRAEEARARFLREARASAALRSSHIVQVFDYGVYEGMPYLVMELLEGQTLEQRLDEGALGYEETVELMRDLCAAIGRAHEHDVIHRDLKPANVFLVSEGEGGAHKAKVLDFGIAKFVGNTGDFKLGETKTGSILGTPYYMSPEQLQESKSVDHRADLWALGVITFQCLTGQRPFESPSLVELCISISTKDAPDPRDLANLPLGVSEWMSRALARDPDQRFASAKDMLAAFEQLDAAPVRAPMPKVKAPTRKRSSVDEPMFDLDDQGPAIGVQLPADASIGSGRVGGIGDTAEAFVPLRGSPNVARERNPWPLVAVVVGIAVLVGAYFMFGRSDEPVEQAGAEPEAQEVVVNDAPAAGEDTVAKPPPTGYGADCKEDSECAWDDPCVPAACVGASEAKPAAACEESGPPPGTCGCVDHHCVMRPSEPAAEGPSCAGKACGLDQARGVCMSGEMTEANEHVELGPACVCSDEGRRCELQWIEPPSCKSSKDCWVTDTPPHYPIARSKQLRKREFRPCKDGAFAPTCRAGKCGLISYSCE